MWIETSPGTFMLGRSASNGLFRGPTILQGNTDGAYNTPGAQVQNAWLAGILNRHLTGANRVPPEAKIAFVSGMIVGGVRPGGSATMVLVDFWDGVSPQPDAAVWPGDQGAIYEVMSLPNQNIRAPFGMLPVPLIPGAASPMLMFRWGTTGDKANKVGYSLWLQGYSVGAPA
jgi:hypothetical protein